MRCGTQAARRDPRCRLSQRRSGILRVVTLPMDSPDSPHPAVQAWRAAGTELPKWGRWAFVGLVVLGIVGGALTGFVQDRAGGGAALAVFAATAAVVFVALVLLVRV